MYAIYFNYGIFGLAFIVAVFKAYLTKYCRVFLIGLTYTYDKVILERVINHSFKIFV